MERKKKTIQLTCFHCDKVFDKELKEFKRQQKVDPDHKFYCSLTCSNSKLDEYSSFRGFVSTAKRNAKNKKLEFDLDVDYIKQLWENQNGKCFYTGLPMLLAAHNHLKEFKPDYASLDRIDSSKGYIKGNVKFVCLSINYAKNSFSEEDFVGFLKRLK